MYWGFDTEHVVREVLVLFSRSVDITQHFYAGRLAKKLNKLFEYSTSTTTITIPELIRVDRYQKFVRCCDCTFGVCAEGWIGVYMMDVKCKVFIFYIKTRVLPMKAVNLLFDFFSKVASMFFTIIVPFLQVSSPSLVRAPFLYLFI